MATHSLRRKPKASGTQASMTMSAKIGARIEPNSAVNFACTSQPTAPPKPLGIGQLLDMGAACTAAAAATTPNTSATVRRAQPRV